MTYLLEELKELRKMVGMKKSGEPAKQFWGCQQCLSNPISWKEPAGHLLKHFKDVVSLKFQLFFIINNCYSKGYFYPITVLFIFT